MIVHAAGRHGGGALALCACAVLIGARARAAVPAAPQAPVASRVARTVQDSARLKAAVEAARDSMKIRGISAAVIFPGGRIWTGQAGESSPGVSVEAATAFDAGSIAKMFTAAVVLQLAEEGAIGLDVPIERWLPDAPNNARVTPRMLLSHTSGWADAWDEPSLIPRLVSAPLKRYSPAEILAATPPPNAEPGAAWDYSSSGYAALGLIAESASGKAFGELVRTRLLERLALKRTVHGAYEDPAEPVAHGWLDINNDGVPEDFTALLPATSWRTAAGPAGAIIGAAADLAVFTRAFVRGELVGPAMREELRGFWVQRPDGNRHGLGLLRTDLDGLDLRGHRGNAAGYSAAAWHAPEADVTVVVLTNEHGLLVTPVVRALLAAAGTIDTAPSKTRR